MESLLLGFIVSVMVINLVWTLRLLVDSKKIEAQVRKLEFRNSRLELMNAREDVRPDYFGSK